MNDNLKCGFCGCELTEESAVRFDGVVMCERCYEQETVPCADCGTVIWIENAQGDDDTHLCDSCYEHYTHCEECGRLIHNSDAYYPDDDDDYSYCYECYQKLEERPIRSYSYKPEPIFYGSGNLYYGIELEIDKGGEFDENAERLLDIANSLDERLYCKHDGSINEGFEIVSHPMSLDYHIHDMNWPDILDKAVNMNYRSHNT